MHLIGHFIVSSNEGNVIKLPVLLLCLCETGPVSHWSYSVVGLGLRQVLLVRNKREKLSFGIILALLMYQCQFLSFAASCTVCLQLCVRADSPMFRSETILEYPELGGTHSSIQPSPKIPL